MIPVLSRAQMRAFDKYAIETCHVPGIVLMENAGRGAADVISAMIEARQRGHRPGHDVPPMSLSPELRLDHPSTPPAVHGGVHGGQGGGEGGGDIGGRLVAHVRRAAADAEAVRLRAFPVRHVKAPGQPAIYPLDARVVVVSGSGSNGGDGFVVARHLLARGAEVEVFLAGSSEKVTGESRINHDAYIDLGGTFTELPTGSSIAPLDAALADANVVVDALFGTGLDRPIHGHLAEVIAAINRGGARCVALDIPSGLDADSGSPLGIAVQADDTVTFGHLKIGLLTPEGARLAGNIHVVDSSASPSRPSSPRSATSRRSSGARRSAPICSRGRPTSTSTRRATSSSWPAPRARWAPRCSPRAPPCGPGRGWPPSAPGPTRSSRSTRAWSR